jgi:8-oxo-dGTP pyrophosphatase MutT (NUDIX family)
MALMLTVADIRGVLDGYRPQLLPNQDDMKKAAVAAVVRDGNEGAELLFIHRAEDERDPWSGHMAFPGGRMDPGDATERAAAIRETFEELALDLDEQGEFLGRLSDVAAVSRGRPLSLVIVPHVFEIEGDPQLVPNHEVAEVVWVPLSYLADHDNRSTVDWKLGHLTIPLPCYRYRDKVIWGLTFGMVDELMEILEDSVSDSEGSRWT